MASRSLDLSNLKSLLDPGTARSFLGRLSGKYNGRKVSVRRITDDAGPGWWHFRVDCIVPLSFEIIPDEALELERALRFPKTGIAGIGRDDEVNDAQLDELFAFRSSDPQRFGLWVRDRHVKQSLATLAFQSRKIILRDRQIHFDMGVPDLLNIADEVLKQLTSLAASAEQHFPYHPGASIPKIRSEALRILVYLLLGSALAAIVYFLTLR